jgi:hypothetical protein
MSAATQSFNNESKRKGERERGRGSRASIYFQAKVDSPMLQNPYNLCRNLPFLPYFRSARLPEVSALMQPLPGWPEGAISQSLLSQ